MTTETNKTKRNWSGGDVHKQHPELRTLTTLEINQVIIQPIQRALIQRKREMGVYLQRIVEWTKLSQRTVNVVLHPTRSVVNSSLPNKTSLYSIYCVARALRLWMRIDFIDMDTGKTFVSIKEPEVMKEIENRVARMEGLNARLSAYYKRDDMEELETKISRGIMLSPKDANNLLGMARSWQGEAQRLTELLSNFLEDEK